MNRQYLAPGLGATLLWISTAAVIVVFLPPPLRPVDYFLAGAIATLVSAVVVFAGFAHVSGIGNLFFRRRPRPSAHDKEHTGTGILGI